MFKKLCKMLFLYIPLSFVLPNPIKRTPKTVAQTHKRKYKAVLTRTSQTSYPFTK